MQLLNTSCQPITLKNHTFNFLTLHKERNKIVFCAFYFFLDCTMFLVDYILVLDQNIPKSKVPFMPFKQLVVVVCFLAFVYVYSQKEIKKSATSNRTCIQVKSLYIFLMFAFGKDVKKGKVNKVNKTKIRASLKAFLIQ